MPIPSTYRPEPPKASRDGATAGKDKPEGSNKGKQAAASKQSSTGRRGALSGKFKKARMRSGSGSGSGSRVVTKEHGADGSAIDQDDSTAPSSSAEDGNRIATLGGMVTGAIEEAITRLESPMRSLDKVVVDGQSPISRNRASSPSREGHDRGRQAAQVLDTCNLDPEAPPRSITTTTTPFILSVQ